jgi:predicted lipoprotein with Yx(FWY)xxD motif
MKRISIVLITLALSAAACGSDDIGTTATEPSGTESGQTESTGTESVGTDTVSAGTSTESDPVDTSATLTLTLSDTDVGSTVVDGDGNTVYLFTNDNGAPTCNDSCADTWPPVPAPASAGTGLDSDLIGSATRTDGAEQATYGGWPLYYYAADTAPGDTNGQGIGGVWFTIDATGNATDAPIDDGY